MTTRLGNDQVIGYKIGGIAAAGSFVLLTNVRDVSLSLSHGEADSTTRANAGWRATEPTLKEAEVTSQIVFDPDDTNYTDLRTAWLNKSLVALALLDGPLTTGDGWRFDTKIFNFSQNEPLEDVVLVDVTFKVARSVSAPSLITGGVNT